MAVRLTREDLERGRDIGATAYMASYVRLMAEELGIDMSDDQRVNAMVFEMIEPLNHATEAIWRALMKDLIGKEWAITRFKEVLNRL